MVFRYCTINEPNPYSVAGYLTGDFPPGRKDDLRSVIRVQPAARVGRAQHFVLFDPLRPNTRLDRLVAGLQDAGFNDFFPRAIQAGAAAFPFSLFAGNLHEVRDTCDYVGINVYYRDLVRFDLRNPGELFGRRSVATGAPEGDPPVEGILGEIYPAGITRVAQRMAAAFGKPIYVTENGVADRADRLRPWELATAVRAAHAAIAQGVDLRGYFHWSLVDNFEWAKG